MIDKAAMEFATNYNTRPNRKKLTRYISFVCSFLRVVAYLNLYYSPSANLLLQVLIPDPSPANRPNPIVGSLHSNTSPSYA